MRRRLHFVSHPSRLVLALTFLQSNQWTCELNNKELTFCFVRRKRSKGETDYRLFFVSLIAMWREGGRGDRKKEYYRKISVIIQCVDVDVSCSWFGVMMNVVSSNIDEWKLRVFFVSVLFPFLIFICMYCLDV